LKQLVETLKILLDSLPWFLLDGIQLRPDVININVPVFLHDQGPQFSPIGWCRLQPFEPLFGSTSQIQLSDLEEFVSIEITHFGRHGESLCPIINILMVLSPEQLIHSLGTSHFASIQ
jgi:hypothetical protein